MTVSTVLSRADADRTFTVDGQTKPRVVEVRVFAPDTPGSYPVVFWSHGHFGRPSDEASILPRQWADQGYIVVVPTHLESIEHPDQRGVLNDRFPPESAQSSIQRTEEMKFLLDDTRCPNF